MENKLVKLPLVALRGLVMFPNSVLSFEIGSKQLVEAVENATKDEKRIFLTAPIDSKTTDPSEKNLYKMGTVSEVKKVLKLPGENVRIIAQGLRRAMLKEYIDNEVYLEALVEYVDIIECDTENEHIQALMSAAKNLFEKYALLNTKIPSEIPIYLANLNNPAEISDIIAANLPMDYKKKQELLEMLDCGELIKEEIQILQKEITILEYQKDILMKTKVNIDQSQKEYQLREQMKVIQEELGDKPSADEEIAQYRERISKLTLPEYALEKLDKELNRLQRIHGYTQESVVIRDYIDWILDLPWDQKSETSQSILDAENILNKEHYGLTKVKERITEYLAVRQNTDTLDSPILCLVGPPGVGKTSIAKSIATALNRKYIRMSLGGVRDEAEIRGHRKTYVGAMPGRIINAMKQAQVTNPLILLDEIDKLSSDYKGDPSSALLEVLDQEQNVSFRDHYIELAYDLSDVLFICTANNVLNIPPALKDRLELIELHSYSALEKEMIAKEFLIKKQIKKHGLDVDALSITDAALQDMITYYTREAGVRQLERLIALICRKTVKASLTGASLPVSVDSENLNTYLGKWKYKKDQINKMPEIGIVRGLAWTSVGGDTLSIEVNAVKGKGKTDLTGNLGKVMKESAFAAMSYIRSAAEKLDIAQSLIKNTDIHIHIPEGAVKKDGPSAGITIATAMISALLNRPVKNDIAMTGEITIRGRILPVGGLKEKILAAKTAGVKQVLLPFDNQNDIEEIEEPIKNGIEIIFVKHMDEVMPLVFAKE